MNRISNLYSKNYISSIKVSIMEDLSFFTPELYPFPKKLLERFEKKIPKKETQIKTEIEDTLDNSSSSSTSIEESAHTFEPSLSKSLQYKQIGDIKLSDLTLKLQRRRFWQLNKYQNSEFWRRIAFCFRSAFCVGLSMAVLSLHSVEDFFVDKIYLMVFIICSITPYLNDTIYNSATALVGTFLALLFPYLSLAVLPLNKLNVLLAIVFSTLAITFFIGFNNMLRIWFIVHNAYFFYLLLNGASPLYPFRQFLEFFIAIFVCILVNLVPYPQLLTKNVNYRTRMAFEQAIKSFELLLLSFSHPFSGRSRVLLAQARKTIDELSENRNYLRQKSEFLWIECMFSFSSYLELKIMLKIINNLLLFLNCLEALVSEQLQKTIKISFKMSESLNEFKGCFSAFSKECVESLLDKEPVLTSSRNRMKVALDSLLSVFRDMRCKVLYFENPRDELGPSKHLQMDFFIFCLTSFFYSFVLLEQINADIRTKGSNFEIALSFLKKKLRAHFSPRKIKDFFSAKSSYVTLVQNTAAFLTCASIAFYTKIYPYTMNLLFAVGFCWTERFSGTFSRNLQRLLGTVLGSFYALFVLTLLGDDIYMMAPALFILVFCNTFIGKNPKYSYLAEVSSFTACVVLLTKKDSSQDIDDEIFTIIKMTFLGVFVSIGFLVLLQARRSISLIKGKIRENINAVREILMEQSGVLKGIRKSVASGYQSESEEIDDRVREGLARNHGTSIWQPVSIRKFTHNEMLCFLNDTLYTFENNYQIISMLLEEADNEPDLFFRKTSMPTLKKFIQFTKKLVNFVVVSAHALNDHEIGDLMQIDAILLDFGEIFIGVDKSLLLIVEFLENPKKQIEESFEESFVRTKKNIELINQNFERYFKSAKVHLRSIARRNIRINISYDSYRRLWGLNPYLFALREILANIISMQEVVIFLDKNRSLSRNK